MASTKDQAEIHPHQFHAEKFPPDAVYQGLSKEMGTTSSASSKNADRS
jgi:hypothetical protein